MAYGTMWNTQHKNYDQNLDDSLSLEEKKEKLNAFSHPSSLPPPCQRGTFLVVATGEHLPYLGTGGDQHNGGPVSQLRTVV